MESTFDAVRAAVADIAKVAQDEVHEGTRFGVDIDTDSLDLYDVVNALELRLGVRVDDHELYDLESVGDLVALLDRLRSTT